MAPRREILDSEDDGSDFSDAPDSHTEPELEIIDASHIAGTESTDPSFFQRIYDQQAAADTIQGYVPDTLPAAISGDSSTWTEISSAPPPAQKQAADLSSFTPVTDPVPTNRKSTRARRQAGQADMIDLTNITTPGKEAASGASDVWDVPSSAPSQKATRTYGKRQRTAQQLSLEQEATSDMPPTQDPYDFPETTPRTRKRAKRETPSSSAQQPQDSSPVMLVPTGETPSSDRRTTRSRGKDGASADTTSLYITQSTLTASQKQEYRMVSLSSEAGLDVPDTSLPGPLLDGGEMHRSSGITTIAYPTPSRIGSSRQRGGTDAASPGPQSSPDVLTDMSTKNSTKAKRSRIKVVSSGGLGSSGMEPPASVTRVKRRKVVQEEDWEEPDPLDDQRDAQDGYEAQNAATPAPQPDPDTDGETYAPPAPEAIDTDLHETLPIASPKPTQKKKLGRKKKGAKAKEPVPPAGPVPEPPAESAGVEPPPAKKKRGRSRKSETTNPDTEPTTTAQAEADDANPNNRASSPQPLSEVSHNSQQATHSAVDADADADGNDDSGESKEEEHKKDLSPPPAVTAVSEPVVKDKEKASEKDKDKGGKGTQNQKVLYRVGLSKKSRIAPLLKCLKKP